MEIFLTYYLLLAVTSSILATVQVIIPTQIVIEPSKLKVILNTIFGSLILFVLFLIPIFNLFMLYVVIIDSKGLVLTSIQKAKDSYS